jgi:hypothetical protein
MKLLGSALAVILTTGTPVGYLDQLFGDPGENKHRYVIVEGDVTVVMNPGFSGGSGISSTAQYAETCDFRDSNVCVFKPSPDIAEIFVELHEPDDAPPEFSFATKWWPTMRSAVEIGRASWPDLQESTRFHDEKMEHGTTTLTVTAVPVQR